MPLIKPFSAYLQFHLLRHFHEPSQRYIQKLSEHLSYPIDELHKQLELPASKFHDFFASDPEALNIRIQETIQDQWQIIHKETDKIDYQLRFEEGRWKEGIGEDALILFKEVDETQINRIQYKQRDNFLVQVLEVDALPNTLQMVVVVAKEGQVITAFPGRWMPPLSQDMVSNWIFLQERRYMPYFN